MLSHGHQDHFGGLVGFLQAHNGKLKRKLPLFVGGNVRNLEQMREVGITRAAQLIAMALGGNFVGATNHPGVFRGAVFAELGELTLSPVPFHEVAGRSVADPMRL